MSAATYPIAQPTLHVAQTPRVRFVPIDEVEATPVRWLLPGRLHAGAVEILEGDPGVGKSTFLSELSAVVTSGRPWLGREQATERGVLWLSSEEDAGSVIRERLEAAGGVPELVRVQAPDPEGTAGRITLPGSVKLLAEAVEAYDIGLIIIDPLVSFIASDLDLNNEVCVRSALDPLSAMARERSCTVVLVRQLKKDRSGPRITHGLGGMAVGAVARSILQLDRPDPTCDRRVLRAIKCTPGPAAPPLQYALVTGNGCPTMSGCHELRSDEDDAAGDLVDAGERHTRADALALLLQLLAKDWVNARTVIQMASAAGIGERTLWKAKAQLGCASRRVGGGQDSYSEWGPPGSADPPLSLPVQSAVAGAGKRKKAGKTRPKRRE
jgi:DNA repair protein RadA/Sms